VYVAISDKLLFKSGSAKVDEKGKEALGVLAKVLEKNPDLDIVVEGHTDSIPIKTERFADNWDLSVIRATSVVRILCTDFGIPPRQITPSGRGEYFPKAQNDTPENRALNRRTEIIIAPKLGEIFKAISSFE
jgi:chemotaxis protein MotB